MSIVQPKTVPKSKIQNIAQELAAHLPFSIFGVTGGLIIMGILNFLSVLFESEKLIPRASFELFHLFHPSHILFSAVATTAMFWKHDNNSWIKAVFVGFVGSVAICGISDVVFPFLGGLLLGADMHWHICLIEEPGLVLPFALIGVFAGLFVSRTFDQSTQYSHSTHVFLSSMASILYLLSFGLTDWVPVLGGVFLVTIFAVMIPCCLSDIVFPLACTHKYCNHK